MVGTVGVRVVQRRGGGLVDRRGLLELPEVTVWRLLFLPWLSFSVASRMCGSFTRCPVLNLKLMVVLVLSGI